MWQSKLIISHRIYILLQVIYLTFQLCSWITSINLVQILVTREHPLQLTEDITLVMQTIS